MRSVQSESRQILFERMLSWIFLWWTPGHIMEMFKHLCVSNYGICNCNEETKGKFLLEQQRRNQRAAVCWSVVILLILGGMSYHLYFLIATYFEYNYIEITESEPGIPEFPDVTVCNMDGVYVLRCLTKSESQGGSCILIPAEGGCPWRVWQCHTHMVMGLCKFDPPACQGYIFPNEKRRKDALLSAGI